MNIYSKYKSITIALLILGGAILLISCGDKKNEAGEESNESLLTEQSDSLVIIESSAGKVAFRFETPLLERYSQAREPYMEFRKGVKVERLDTLGTVESTLVSDYAIYFEKQELWEAKGNVVATNSQGHVLETQQLFWNRRTKKIYSNIDSKMTQNTDVLYGIGFESDEDFKVWEVRRPRGKAAVDIEPNRDTTTVSSTDTSKVVKYPNQGTDNSLNNNELRPAIARPQPTAPQTAVRNQEIKAAPQSMEDSKPRPRSADIEKVKSNTPE